MDSVAKRAATSFTSTAAPKCPQCAWTGATSGNSCKSVFVLAHQKLTLSEQNVHADGTRSLKRRHQGRESSRARGFKQPPLTRLPLCCQVVPVARRQRRPVPAPADLSKNERILNAVSKVGQRFQRVPGVQWFGLGWQQFLMRIYYLKPRLPPLMACSIRALMETMCNGQDLVCEILQSKIEMFDHATVRADKMSASVAVTAEISCVCGDVTNLKLKLD